MLRGDRVALDLTKTGPVERDIEQAITALKKGAYLLKYGRRGKPKFCPFRLSNDESVLAWFSGKDEKHLKLSHISRIISGQRTEKDHALHYPCAPHTVRSSNQWSGSGAWNLDATKANGLGFLDGMLLGAEWGPPVE